MKRPAAACLVLLAAAGPVSGALADTDAFDQGRPGVVPVGWTCGVTGSGSPRWAVEADVSAPSPPNVLIQSGSGTFPWCVKRAIAITDGYIEVRFKPVAGREDQAGGLIWRWKDGDNYYVARANALENNLSLYYTEGGQRMTLMYVDAPVAPRQWHALRVEFTGTHFTVILDGKTYVELDDSHVRGAGSVGVWTKADSVTAFDDFSFGGH